MENKNLDDQPEDQNQETIFSPDEFSTQGYDKHIRQARNAIFAVAVLLVINLLILGFTIPESMNICGSTSWCGVFLLPVLFSLVSGQKRNLTMPS